MRKNSRTTFSNLFKEIDNCELCNKFDSVTIGTTNYIIFYEANVMPAIATYFFYLNQNADIIYIIVRNYLENHQDNKIAIMMQNFTYDTVVIFNEKLPSCSNDSKLMCFANYTY